MLKNYGRIFIQFLCTCELGLLVFHKFAYVNAEHRLMVNFEFTVLAASS